MPLPHPQPTTLLQRLDNLGHRTLRFGRSVRRFFLRVGLNLLWLFRQFFVLVAFARHVFLTLRACLRLARTQRGLRRTEAARPRFYLVDPSYEDALGHYRTVAQYLAQACVERGWVFIHLTGRGDLALSSRIPIFSSPARLPLRAITLDRLADLRKFAPARRSAKALGRFRRLLRVVLALDRGFGVSAPSYFYFHTGDFLYFLPLLSSARLDPRQHLFFMQFYLPLHFELRREQLRFERHAHLLARGFAHDPSRRSQFHLCSDSPRLLASLAPILGEWPRYLGHPLLSREALAALPAPEHLAHRPHPCGYFGYFSGKHGWPVVRRLLQAQAGRDCRWLLGLNVKHREHDTIVAAENSARAAGATLRLGYWPDDEYAAALDRCSTLFLPYDSRQYALVSSAKLIDALLHGCLPVVPAETWLADIVRSVDYGFIVSAAEWSGVPARLADLDLPALWAARRERVHACLSQFTAQSFLDSLASFSG